MNDIIAFVKKAMNKNLKVEYSFGGISIYNNKKEIRIVQVYSCDVKQTLIIVTNNGKTHDLEMSEEDVLKWKLLTIECKNYQNNMAVKDFNDFFDKEDLKPTTINDLDNEDD